MLLLLRWILTLQLISACSHAPELEKLSIARTLMRIVQPYPSLPQIGG